MTFAITSPSFEDRAIIPAKFTCDGKDLSPALEWAGYPQSTKSFVLICDDPDAPRGTWDHWVVFNIPADINKFEEGARQFPKPVTIGKNTWGRNDYGGPCPPHGEHRYYFKLYALDIMLDLGEDSTKEQVTTAMNGHILGQAELMGRYSRPA
jgi:hypothetical protein